MPEATLQICFKFLPMRNGGMKPLGILLRFIVLLTLRVRGVEGIDSLNRYFLISLVQLWGVLLEILGPLRVKLIVVEERLHILE